MRTVGRSPWLSSWMHWAGRVRPLVKLAGQVFNSKNVLAPRAGLAVGGVYRRLAEDSRDGLLEQDVVDALDIIAVDAAAALSGP